MSRDLTGDFSALFDDKIRLPAQLDALRDAYRNAKPFPHLVIDQVFSSQILDPLVEEMAGISDQQWLLIRTEGRESIRRMRSGVELGAAGLQLVSLVHSASFLYLLSEITGIWQLLPDPYLQGAGYAKMKRGDFFNVHSDRNIAYETGLSRRLAMIVFLNNSWDPEYKGQLELWNSDATRCDASIEPLYNRTVIFEVAFPNYHGVPAPIACPADRSRQSFIVYYHTVGIDGKEHAKPHTSIFAPAFYGSSRPDSTLRSLARELSPPLLVKTVKKLVVAWKNKAARSL